MSDVKDPALNSRDHVPEPVALPPPPQNPHLPPFVFPLTTDPVEEIKPVDLAAELVASGHVVEVELTPGLEERVEAEMERLDDQGGAQEVVTSAPDLRDVLISEADAFEEDTPPLPRSPRRKK